MNVTPCLGGWCKVREKCANYLVGTGSRDDIRLCARGKEMPSPVHVRPDPLTEINRVKVKAERQRDRQEMYQQLTDHEMGRISLNDADLKAYRAAVTAPKVAA
jgi:hypothetical protein